MKFQIKRAFSQFFFLISANLGAIGFKTGFCYPFFYCHSCPTSSAACPLRALEQSVYDVRENSISWKLLLYPLLILGFVGVLSGRAVCGWACPIGFLQRVAGNVARRLKKYPLIEKIGKLKIERGFRYIKYILLISLIVLTPAFINFMFTDICPVGFLTGTIPILTLNPGKFVPNPFFAIAFVIFFLFISLILMIERGWCRYFCPVGAILAPFNRISLLSIKIEKEKCIHCDACSKICPMGINVATMNRDPECIFCGKCVNACPNHIIHFTRE